MSIRIRHPQPHTVTHTHTSVKLHMKQYKSTGIMPIHITNLQKHKNIKPGACYIYAHTVTHPHT